MKVYKILLVGVFDFDAENKSTSNSQMIALHNTGHHIRGYNYRIIAEQRGLEGRDRHLVETIKKYDYDLVILEKCNQVSFETFKQISNHTTTCLWFMDPLVSYNNEMRTKTALVDYFCCDKENVLEEAKLINHNSFHVCEGFDERVDRPQPAKKEYDVSFIGSVYGKRKDWINRIKHPVKIISDAYGLQHALEVSKSKINLNFCTTNGASDRVYKVLAASGFLLSDDWAGRKSAFEDGKHLVIYDGIDDLNDKIEFYLSNNDVRNEIAIAGHKEVQKYNRSMWAKKIIRIYKSLKQQKD